jgi:parvulin-like peptidyl-prolyl isomerase
MSFSRNRTTAEPKAGKSNRKFKPRSQREAEINRLVLIISGVILGVIALILGIALLVDGVIVPNQAVARVGSQNITTREFQSRVRFERWRAGNQLRQVAQLAPSFLSDSSNFYGQLYQSLEISSLFGQQVLDQMIEARIVQQYAAENGISVSEAEATKQINEYFGFNPTPMTETPTTTPTITLTPLVSATPSSTPSATPTATPGGVTNTPAPTSTLTATPFPTGLPTATPELATRQVEFETNSKNYYAEAAKQVGISEADLRAIIVEQALKDKVIKAVAGEPPKEQEQIKARHILVKTKEAADDVLTSLKNGASFTDLARSISQDPGSAQSGGELDWAGKGVYFKAFEDAIWNAKVGDIVGPIDTTKDDPQRGGFHIIQITGREIRPLNDTQSKEAQTRAYDEWLKQQKESKSESFSAVWSQRVPSDPTLAELGLPARSELPPAQSNPFGQ